MFGGSCISSVKVRNIALKIEIIAKLFYHGLFTYWANADCIE